MSKTHCEINEKLPPFQIPRRTQASYYSGKHFQYKFTLNAHELLTH